MLYASCFFLSSCDKKKDPQVSSFGPEDTSFYKVYFEGTIPSYLLKEIQDKSILQQLIERPPLSPKALEHRTAEDLKNITLVCHEYGYFETKVTYKIETSRKKLKVRILIELGDPYTLGNITISTFPNHVASIDPLKHLNLRKGDDIYLEKIKLTSLLIQQYFQNQGYPFAQSQLPKATLDPTHKKLNLEFIVELDQKMNFDLLNILHLDKLKDSYVRNRVLWETGQPYSDAVVKKTQKKLIDTGLFSSVVITQEKQEGRLQTNIETTEAPPRLIGGSLRYSTSESISGRLFWTHYNFAGGGEKLGTSLEHGLRNSEAKVFYDIPDVFRPEWQLKQEIAYQREKNKAYKSHIGKIEVNITQPWGEYFKNITGINYEKGRVLRHGIKQDNSLVSFSLKPDLDTSDSHVDPIQGFKIAGYVAPHFDTKNKKKFTQMKIAFIHYLRLWERDKGILVQEGEGLPAGKGLIASWLRGGYIFAQDLEHIPIYKRLYCGGPGSIRGYGLKMVGLLDSKNAPVGGKTLFEIGTEIRYHLVNSFGGVAFIEAGGLDTRKRFQFNKDSFVGSYGLGLRYFTKMGPIRFDIAFPTKRRKGSNGKFIDAPFQIYLSFGQAF